MKPIFGQTMYINVDTGEYYKYYQLKKLDYQTIKTEKHEEKIGASIKTTVTKFIKVTAEQLTFNFKN